MRFSGHTNEWQTKRIDTLFEFVPNNSISRDGLNYDGGVWKNIHYGDILTVFPTVLDIRDGHVPYISSPTFSPQSSLSTGDVVIADTAEDYTAGKALEIVISEGIKAVPGLHTIACHPKVSFAPGFLGYCLNSSAYKERLRPLIQGIKVYSVSKSSLATTSISFPSYDEQYKIGLFLSIIDRRIAVQNKIIRSLESLMNGISTLYFARIPDYFKTLDNLIQIGKAGGTPKSTNADFYRGDIPFLSIADMTRQGKYIKSTDKHINAIGLRNSSAWIVPENSLILSMYASVGLACINKVPLATSQAMFSMVLKASGNLDYLYYFLEYFRKTQMHKYLETGTQSNINADTVKSIKVPFYENQSTYVKTMLAVERKLNDEKEKLTVYISLKKALLRDLFI